MKALKEMAQRLRDYAADPAANGMVPIHPKTLKTIADLLDPLSRLSVSGPYRVELDPHGGECLHCEQKCQLWTIVRGQGDAECGIGQSWGNKDMAEDICYLMNMAASSAQAESSTAV